MRAALCYLAWALALVGCAGYKLGPTQPVAAGSRTVQVVPFENKTHEPRLSEAVTHAVRKWLQQDGTYRLDTRGQGDLLVTGAILEYRRSGLSSLPSDVITPRDYTVAVVAKVAARERATGKTVVDREVSGRTTLRVGQDLVSSERQALPLAAEDLARNVTALLVDGEW
jgi:hypothetical protein